MHQLGNRLEQDEFSGLILDFRESDATDLHHALLLADALVGETTLMTMATQTGTRELKTEQDRTIPKLKIAVLPGRGASGAMMLVLKALKKRGNVVFLGRPVLSAGLFTQSFELPGWGALNSVPFGRVVSDDTSSQLHGPVVMDASGNSVTLSDLRIDPTIPSTESSEALIEQATKIFE